MNYNVLDSDGNVHRGRTPIDTQTLTASTTLTLVNSEKVLSIATDALTQTLPAVGATTAPKGTRFIFVNSGADANNIITISPNASDKIYGSYNYNGRTIYFTGTDNKDAVNTKATAKKGDYLILESDGSVGWRIVDAKGIWAEESVTFQYGKGYMNVTGATTITGADAGKTLILNAAAGAQVTLPAVASATDVSLRIIVGLAFATTDWTIVAASNVIEGGAIVNSVYVVASNENTISFVASAESVGDYVDLYCDGTNWYVSGMGSLAGSITFTAP